MLIKIKRQCQCACVGLLLLLSACNVTPPASVAAQHDPEPYLVIAKMIDSFYSALKEQPPEQRRYADWHEQYQQIGIELRNLVLRTRLQPANSESVALASQASTFWQTYQQQHQSRWEAFVNSTALQPAEGQGAYPNTLIQEHQARFIRLISAMATPTSP